MDLKIDYVEFESDAIGASTDFFAKACGWRFNDYGPGYQEIANGGIGGGINGQVTRPGKGPLVILKTDNLVAAERAIVEAGGEIIVPPYSFPGGKRFHFREPGGNELAVWAEAG